MNSTWKRSFALILSLVMVVGMLPVSAFADETEHTHTYSETVTTAATCTEDGVKTFTCGTCEDSYTEAISATGHSYVEGVCGCGATEHTHSYDEVVSDTATCTEAGVKTTKCSCGATSEVESAAKGHSYDEVVSDTATCTEAGVKTTKCSCGATNEEESAAKGHSYSDGTVTTEATCATAGVLTKTCNGCGATETEAIAATGNHNYVDGVCTVCTAAEPVVCDGTDWCAAENHETTCPAYDWCAALGCTDEQHAEGCPYTLPCDKTEGCELVKNHPGDCTGMDTMEDENVVEVDTLAELNAAFTDAKDAKLIANITYSGVYGVEWVNVPAGVDVVLDLNGYTLSQTTTASGGLSGSAIVVRAGAALTVKDSSSNGTGKISACNSAFQLEGKLTLESGSVVIGETHSGADVSAESGFAYGVWMYMRADATVAPEFYMTGGSISMADNGYTEDNVNAVAMDSGVDGVDECYSAAKISITGGNVSGSVVVHEKCESVTVPSGTEVVKYADPVEIDTLEELLTELASGSVADIYVTASITIPNGETVELDLNGKTVNLGENYIENNGTLTVTNGSLIADTYNNTTNGAPILNKGTLTLNANLVGVACIIRTEGGAVTINGGSYTMSGRSGTTCNMLRIKSGSTVTVNDGTFSANKAGTDSTSIVSADSGTTTTIAGGYFSGYHVNSIFAATENELTITGGTFVNDNVAGEVAGETRIQKYLAEGFKLNVNGSTAIVEDARVAFIGEKGYATVQAALEAAKDGETIQLVWEEGDEPISSYGVVSGKTVTITGTATFKWDQNIWIGRNGTADGTLIFDGANITSSTKANPGSVGFHVSGYNKTDADSKTHNGTLIIRNSTIETDYLINRNEVVVESGTLTVYGGHYTHGRDASESSDGTVKTAKMTIASGATVHIVNENTMGIGNEGNGELNVAGTYTANVLNINSDTDSTGTVNINGGTINITGNVNNNGAINVNGGNLTVGGTLSNAGTTYVTGTSDVSANVTGSGWVYMNGATLSSNTKLLGAKVGFINGTNTIVGSTIDNGWFSVGIGKGTEADVAAEFAAANSITLGDVTVNVSGDAVIGSGSDAAYTGWIGSAYSADKTVYKYALNIENSQASFGYLHISKDGTLNVKGHTTNKYTNDNSSVDFYVGDFIINGVATFDGTDAWVRTTKISVDHADGILNIKNGTKYEASWHIGANTGNALIFYGEKAGIANIDASTLEIDNVTTINAASKLNVTNGSKVTANGAVINNGILSAAIGTEFKAATGVTISGTGTILVDGTGFTGGEAECPYGTSNIKTFTGEVKDNSDLLFADKKVIDDNTVHVVLATAVAQVGDKYYADLQTAIDAADNGETVTLLKDVTVDEGVNAVNISGNSSFTLDLNGKTLTANTSNAAVRININNDKVTAPVTINIKNGTVTAGSSAYCALIATGKSSSVPLTVNLEEVKLNGSNSNGSVVKGFANSIINVKSGTVITGADSYGAMEIMGTANVYDGAEIYQNGTTSYNGMLIGVCYGGTANVYGGNGKSVKCGLMAMTSGGTINVSGGTWIANTDGTQSDNSNFKVLTAQNSKKESGYAGASEIKVTGGIFKGSVDAWGLNTGDIAKLEISGGNFNIEPSDGYIVEGYGAIKQSDNTYTVAKLVSSGDDTFTSLDDALDQQVDSIEIPKNPAYDQFKEVNGEHENYPEALTINANGNVITGTGYISSGYAITIDNLTAKNHDVVMPDGGVVSFTEKGTTTFTPNFLEDKGYGRVNVTDNKGKTRYFYLDAGVSYTIAAGGTLPDDKLIIEGTKNGPTYLTHAEQNVLHDNKHYINKDPNMLIYCNGFYGSVTKIWITGGQYGTNRLYVYENDKEQVDDIDVAPGCTIVTLNKDYLNDLDVGDYTIHFQYLDHDADESVSQIFKVRVKSTSVADETNPKTGDSIFVAVSVMTFSAAALAVLLMGNKKKRVF